MSKFTLCIDRHRHVVIRKFAKNISQFSLAEFLMLFFDYSQVTQLYIDIPTEKTTMRYVERIPALKKACCCCDLRNCCVVVGALQLPILLLFVFAEIHWLVSIIDYSISPYYVVLGKSAATESSNLTKNFVSVDFIMIVADILVNIALVIATIFFIGGALNRNMVHVDIYVRAIPYIILLYIILGAISFTYFIDQAISYFIIARKYFESA